MYHAELELNASRRHKILVLEPFFGNIFDRFKDEPASVTALRMILFQLLLALKALEKMGIVHLNVRTQNVMCSCEHHYFVKVGHREATNTLKASQILTNLTNITIILLLIMSTVSRRRRTAIVFFCETQQRDN